MKIHKLLPVILPALALPFLSSDSLAQSKFDLPGADSGPNVPRIQDVERRFLTQVVHRTMVAEARNQKKYVPIYVPPSLTDVDCQIVVRVRLDGYNCGIGISEQENVVKACQQGARRAYQSANAAGMEGLEFLSKASVEIEALGPLTPFPADKKWTAPGALDAFIEPGVDGVCITLDDDQRWFTPGEMLAKNVSMDEALRTLFKELSLDPAAIPSGQLAKFRTMHWWQESPGGKTVLLRRGMTGVDPSMVAPSSLERVIQQLTRYLIYRQLPNGSFRYVFDPSADVYLDKTSFDADAAAGWALAVRAATADDENARGAADRAIEALHKRVIELPKVDGAAFVATPEMKNKLGVTAQLCLAMAEAPAPERFAVERDRLVKAMLWLQLPNGRFVTAFPPAQILPLQDVYPGQALLALARCYEAEPCEDILNAFDRALEHYRVFFANNGPPMMVPWQTRAFAAMARMTKKRAYADFVFQMNDRVCDHQLWGTNSRYPELWGAITAQGLPPTASTAAFVAGLVDAAELANRLGDTDRYERYTEAAQKGARFVMQLQFRRDECYFVRSPQDTVDGIRRSPIDCRLSTDDCANALMALTQVHRLLESTQP